MNYKHRILLYCLLTMLMVSCKDNEPEAGDVKDETTEEAPKTPKQLTYSFVGTLPHDTTSFTEGLLIHEGKLYESTGSPDDMPGTKSVFGEVDRQTGNIEVKVELDRTQYFGEGITFLNGKLYMLTYETKIGFIYDARTFKKVGEFRFPSKEGWGMTTDGTSLIMSDGTSTLTWLEPGRFKTVRTLEVTDETGPVRYLNELEYVNGSIYANAYTTNVIVRIDPTRGKVTGKLDLTNLARQAEAKYAGSLEMNGIAYDPADNTMYFTGKMWPYIFKISVAD
jgi:glutamine cyclotransferase